MTSGIPDRTLGSVPSNTSIGTTPGVEAPATPAVDKSMIARLSSSFRAFRMKSTSSAQRASPDGAKTSTKMLSRVWGRFLGRTTSGAEKAVKLAVADGVANALSAEELALADKGGKDVMGLADKSKINVAFKEVKKVIDEIVAFNDMTKYLEEMPEGMLPGQFSIEAFQEAQIHRMCASLNIKYGSSLQEARADFQAQHALLTRAGKTEAAERVGQTIKLLDTVLQLFDSSGKVKRDGDEFKRLFKEISVEKLNFEVLVPVPIGKRREVLAAVMRLKANLGLIASKEADVKRATKELTSALTEEEKTEANAKLAMFEAQLKTLKEESGKIQSAAEKSIGELREHRDVLKQAGKSEAANVLDGFLQLLDDSGKISSDHSKLYEFIYSQMNSNELMMEFNGRAGNLRAYIWGEDNYLREPLTQASISQAQDFYRMAAGKFEDQGNKDLILGLADCLDKLRLALDEFHAVEQGVPAMKEMIGKTKNGHTFLKDQDLSGLTDSQLNLIEEKAKKLKGSFVAIHGEMKNLCYDTDKKPRYKQEGVPIFGALKALYTQVEIPLCAITGEKKQAPGGPETPLEQTGQVDLLLGMISKEREARGIE